MLAKRDLAVMLLSLFAVYHSLLRDGVVSFDRAWYVPAEESSDDLAASSARGDRAGPGTFASSARFGGGGVAATRSSRAPPPVFFDLNGDGVNEMIVASRTLAEIRVVSVPSSASRRRRRDGGGGAGGDGGGDHGDEGIHDDDADVFAALTTTATASLLPANTRVVAGRTPIALAAGHLTPPRSSGSSSRANSNVKTRKAVVVVVTSGWHLLCFDHNLRLLWEVALSGEFPRRARIREVAVVVSAHATYEGDVGAVIVGGRVETGTRDDDDEGGGGGDSLGDAFERQLDDEDVLRTHRGGAKATAREMEAAEKDGSNAEGDGTGAGKGRLDRSRHFNYYAFEGKTGARRWKHESEDFHRDVDALVDRLTPQHDYRLDAGAFTFTLVPIRPRRRGERQSLRTSPIVFLRPGSLAFNPRPRRLSTPPDAFELHSDNAL